MIATTPIHRPCANCDMDTRSECDSWEHLKVDPLVVLRLTDAFRGRDVPRWVVELIADEFFADSPTFDRERFLLRTSGRLVSVN